MQLSRLCLVASLPIAFAVHGISANALTVFSDDFNSGLPSEFSGAGELAGVQGFSGLGPSGNQFGVQFLHNTTTSSSNFLLTDLPAHSEVSIGFLLAVIDSWDGSGAPPPSGDFFAVSVDGVEIFNESFVNSLPFTQTYVPPQAVNWLAEWT